MMVICLRGNDAETAVYLNRDHIVSFHRYEDTTTVFTDDKKAYFVRETPAEILEMLGCAIAGPLGSRGIPFVEPSHETQVEVVRKALETC